MSSIMVTRHEDAVFAALNALDTAVDTLLTTDYTVRRTREQVQLLRRLEAVASRLPAIEHRLISAVRDGATPAELGDPLATALANALRITPKDAKQRVSDAAELGPRRTLSGQPLPPWLPVTAAAQANGSLGAGHVQVIRDFFADLPGHIQATDRERAERDLVRHARGMRPDELKKLADRMLALYHPDGDFSDSDRARHRGVSIGPQRPDGMSSISGDLTPEARATIDAVFAKLARPGMCNPDDDTPTGPCVDADPSPEQSRADHRSQRQRNHDALLASGRALLASGDLGQLNGLPTTIIVSTTLAELESGAGQALTAGGTLLPMSDVLRLAGHAHHYLALFDGNSVPLDLQRSRRTATAGQRIVLLSKERGCTRPGCTANGYQTQVHHAVADWKDNGQTNINDLTLACRADNLLVENTEWTTRKRPDGVTEWIPPPHLDTGQKRTNDYHHPDRLIKRGREADDPP
jgi:Domain of unknown function (DUF222)